MRKIWKNGRLNRALNFVPARHRAFISTFAAGAAILVCSTYCLIWFRPDELTLWEPDVAITCWAYCVTLHPFWGMVALGSGTLTVINAVLSWRTPGRAKSRAGLILGVATFPIGLFTIYGAHVTGRLAREHSG